jgi:hypothetical protein
MYPTAVPGCTSRGVDERVKVRVHAVHPAVREEAEEVQAAAARLGVVDDLGDDGVRADASVVHGVVDARDVHHRDSPGAEVQVPHLAVAHLSRG